ncbi:MAG: FHA domain-containing protein [Ardenticatenaceae bacterium]
MDVFLDFWQSWPVFITALVTLGVTIYTFLPHQNSSSAAMAYQIVTVMAFILAVPAVLVHERLDLQLFQITPTIKTAVLWLNVVGGVVALLSFLLSVIGVGQRRVAPPVVQPFHQPQSQPQPAVQPLSQVGPPLSQAGYQPIGTQTPASGSPLSSTLADSDVPGLTNQSGSHTSLAPSGPVAGTINEPESDKTILLRPKSGSQYFAWLIELNGARQGSAHPLTQSRNVIGRGQGAQIRIQDRYASMQHAALVRDEARKVFVLHDLASANSTYLHDQLLNAPQPVKDKDKIRIGETVLHFMEIRMDEQKKPAQDAANASAPAPSLAKGGVETVVLSTTSVAASGTP